MQLNVIEKRLRKLALEYRHAAVNLAFLGASDPESHDEIRAEFKKTRKRLYKEMRRLSRMVLYAH